MIELEEALRWCYRHQAMLTFDRHDRWDYLELAVPVPGDVWRRSEDLMCQTAAAEKVCRLVTYAREALNLE